MNKITRSRSKSRHLGLRRASWLGLCALLWVAAGCEKGTSESATAQAPAQAVATGAASADGNQNLNEERYELGSPKDALKVGQTQEVALTIEAAEGLKVNEEFPWSIDFKDCDGVDIAHKEISMDQIKLEGKRASIPVTLSALAPGKHTLNAVGNFSVCNDTQCYVIRNQKIAFNVEASGSEEDAPAAAN